MLSLAIVYFLTFKCASSEPHATTSLNNKGLHKQLVIKSCMCYVLHCASQQCIVKLAADLSDSDASKTCMHTQCHAITRHAITPANVVQVMTMKQSAQLLMHSDPDLILAEVLLHHIAAQQGLPSKEEMLSAHKHLTTQNWTRFWQYTEAVNPCVSLRDEYIPIPVTAPIARPMISQSQVQPVTSTIMLY